MAGRRWGGQTGLAALAPPPDGEGGPSTSPRVGAGDQRGGNHGPAAASAPSTSGDAAALCELGSDRTPIGLVDLCDQIGGPSRGSRCGVEAVHPARDRGTQWAGIPSMCDDQVDPSVLAWGEWVDRGC